MIFKKILAAAIVFSLGFGTTFAYEEINCSSDPSFKANSCNQCFDGWNKDAWSNIGLLTDDWLNPTNIKLLLYKEAQEFPKMVNLNKKNVDIVATPSSENFWEYTDEFNALYSEREEWYVLPAGERVTWLKSKLGYAYNISKNTAAKGSNIAMLIFPITTHEILSDWDITVDGKEHRECVLFKSWQPKPSAKKLPPTGPEAYILLVILALILGFWVIKFRKKY